MDQETLNEVKEELALEQEQQADDAGAVDASSAEPVADDKGPEPEPKSTADAALEALGLPAQTKPEAKADEKAADSAAANADPAKPDAAAKKQDDLADLSPKAQNRFQELTQTLREKDTQLAEANKAIDFVRQTIGETPQAIENFKAFGAYQRAIETGDIETAQKVLVGQLEQLAMLSGKASITVDPLAAFPDLRGKVDAFELDEQTALELARSRTVQQNQQRFVELQHQTQQQQLETQQARIAGQQAVGSLCEHLAATDPDYLAKERVLLEQVAVIRDNYPPHMWATQLQLAYNVATQALKAQQQSLQPRRNPGAIRSTGLSGQRQLPEDTAGRVLADPMFAHLQK